MIRCNNCGADIEETQTQCPYCHAMQYEASEKEYMNHLYKMNDTMDGLDENANRYIRNRIICHAVITLAAVAAALLVGTAWGYTKYRSYYNSASERREIAEGMAWYDENVQIHCAMMIKSHRERRLKAMNLKICTEAAWNI